MQEERTERQPVGIWILVVVCALAVVFTLACGAAYSGIQQARLTAAKASLGQIESVFYLAERMAADDGLRAPGAYENVLRSYESSEEGAELSEYEKAVRGYMLDYFGTGREFDFAVTRYGDAGNTHVQVYFFPTRGRTNIGSDRYYVAVDGNIVESSTS